MLVGQRMGRGIEELYLGYLAVFVLILYKVSEDDWMSASSPTQILSKNF